jgi:hypothetical protein
MLVPMVILDEPEIQAVTANDDRFEFLKKPKKKRIKMESKNIASKVKQWSSP